MNNDSLINTADTGKWLKELAARRSRIQVALNHVYTDLSLMYEGNLNPHPSSFKATLENVERIAHELELGLTLMEDIE